MAANEDEEHGNDEQDQDNETNQEATTFWQRIRTVYCEAVPRPIQTFTSLKKRWSNNLQPAINKFRAIVHQVKGFNKSGASVEDQLNRALRLFATDQGTHFKHLRCYNLLVKSPKWNTYCRDNNIKEAGKKTKTINQLAAQDQSWKQDVACAHKEITSKSKQLNDIFNHDSQSINCMSQNGTTSSELAIMTTDLNGVDDEQKEYFKLKRAAILQSLRAQGNSSTN
ncbi:hypothetical protein PGT21_003019 [Puccinia graminis f. sp. tritici]|uniref:No apical meristem-associated C-terminal domain-containing protein n=1 Tax=Puccinia graminis f. sp. tritici TaxID=56615 RepID=A0A5B0NBD8_PUCGR|nr:hypothetical protein PGT21_003019 [Puccinia graminis f. sp. tritici]